MYFLILICLYVFEGREVQFLNFLDYVWYCCILKYNMQICTSSKVIKNHQSYQFKFIGICSMGWAISYQTRAQYHDARHSVQLIVSVYSFSQHGHWNRHCWCCLSCLYNYADCLFLQANEGRKDESLTSGAMEITNSTVEPINTIFFEKPIINVVASYCMHIRTVYWNIYKLL